MIHSLTFLLVWLCPLLMHPVHVTVSSAEYNANKQELTFSVKFFYDDLETILNKKYNANLKLLPQKTVSSNEQLLIEKYINENLNFVINKKQKTAKIIKSQYNYDALWVYLQVPKVKKINTLTVKNKLMLDLFRDQTNLFIYKDNVREIGTQFDFETQKKTLF